VLHGHSVANTVLSRAAGDAIRLAGYELLKAFPGGRRMTRRWSCRWSTTTRTSRACRPALDALWDRTPDAPPGYLIRGHGAYVWGADMDQAMARLEALEFMLLCDLEEGRHAMSLLTIRDAAPAPRRSHRRPGRASPRR
jgi:methylthioribulose-1-phosphate dehydratase